MEYGINFDNDSANDHILSALAELNNTFFIENNSSFDEKSISDDEVVSNFNDIENDTQDKVYDNIKLKVKEFFDKGKCICNSKYLRKLNTRDFLHIEWNLKV
ncbi:hypothetical protein C1645_841479 [Glomus cerebriforme]|uniref:Uncharacterized protein n=1 Tax=Glomus cerebriforme TaxID=658196 RepID=A0A397S552_9GLOM|nr:hypothetical protein C1645_841479 [Glomus cerebriforme]